MSNTSSAMRRSLTTLIFSSVICICSVSVTHAGNVQVVLEGEQLKITGDSSGNDITIAQNTRGDAIITGRNGTTINGQASVRFPLAILNTVEILMAGGNDDVLVNGLTVNNDLFANLGAGNDSFRSGTKPTQILNNLSTEGGSGNEVIRIATWFITSDLYIDGQVGTLNARLDSVTVDFNMTLIGDDARDVLRVIDCTAGDTVSLETKKGNDLVEVTGLSSLSLAATLDEGADDIILTEVMTAEDILVSAGPQSDVVEMTDVTSGKNITVSLDAGDDIMDGVNVLAQFDAVFEGGAGTDTYIDGNIAGLEKTDVKEFEIFLP